MSQRSDTASRNEVGDRAPDAGQNQSTAEWVTLGLSVAVVLLLVALISYQHLTGSGEEPIVRAEPRLTGLRHDNGWYYLEVAVTNRGDLTAQEVRVQVTLAPRQAGGEPETGEFVVQFLAGGATKSGIIAFRNDPSQGEVTIESISFIVP